MLEAQDGLAEEGEHQAVVDLQGEPQDDLQDGLQGDLQDDLLQAGAVRATPKGSLQQKYVSCRIYDGATWICVTLDHWKHCLFKLNLEYKSFLMALFLDALASLETVVRVTG